ncbi:hypothetical protein HMPREF1500_1793 [Fusobacterium sp. CM22]|nr:hypothetical protein HMPREF1500_1793 [Fusobacterium sp. CM22]
MKSKILKRFSFFMSYYQLKRYRIFLRFIKNRNSVINL